MITDREWLFTGTFATPAQSMIVGGAGDIVSTNTHDSGPLSGSNTGIDWGAPHLPMEFYVLVTTALVGAGGTIIPRIETDALVAFGSPVTLFTFSTIAAAAPIGTTLRTTIDVGLAWERRFRLVFAAGAAITAGALIAGATPLGCKSVAKSFAIGSNFA